MTSAERQRLVEAISEGLLRQYDEEMSTIEKHPRCSKQHYEKMSEIVGFKVRAPRRISKKGLAAILLAAVLLLTGCAVFKNEIRDFFVEVYEKCVEISFRQSEHQSIAETYGLSYMLDGYVQIEEKSSPSMVHYRYTNQEEHIITFEQVLLDGSSYNIDAEHGEDEFLTVDDHQIYYRNTDQYHVYIWSDGKYAMSIHSDVSLTMDDLEKLVRGVTVRKNSALN
jgi:hypothetical protein